MSKVQLKNRHLVISHELVDLLFPNASHVYMVYYATDKKLLLAPSTDAVFKSLHKTSMQMLKDKNLKGDKSLSLEELIIDHDLREQDQELSCKMNDKMGILTVYLD